MWCMYMNMYTCLVKQQMRGIILKLTSKEWTHLCGGQYRYSPYTGQRGRWKPLHENEKYTVLTTVYMYKIILRLRATLWEECLRIATLHSCICGLAEEEKSFLVFVLNQVQGTCTRKLSRNLRNFIFLQTFTSTECVFINLQAYTSCVGVWIHYQHWSEYLLVSGMPCKWDASTNLNTGLVCLTSIFEVSWVVPIDLQVWLQRHKINNVKNPKDARRVTTWSPAPTFPSSHCELFTPMRTLPCVASLFCQSVAPAAAASTVVTDASTKAMATWNKLILRNQNKI